MYHSSALCWSVLVTTTYFAWKLALSNLGWLCASFRSQRTNEGCTRKHAVFVTCPFVAKVRLNLSPFITDLYFWNISEVTFLDLLHLSVFSFSQLWLLKQNGSVWRDHAPLFSFCCIILRNEGNLQTEFLAYGAGQKVIEVQIVLQTGLRTLGLKYPKSIEPTGFVEEEYVLSYFNWVTVIHVKYPITRKWFVLILLCLR